jgi:hypothetical protein
MLNQLHAACQEKQHLYVDNLAKSAMYIMYLQYWHWYDQCTLIQSAVVNLIPEQRNKIMLKQFPFYVSFSGNSWQVAMTISCDDWQPSIRTIIPKGS